MADWRAAWGLGDPALTAGGLTQAEPQLPARQVWLLQRKAKKPGRGLGKTTGWIHRAHLAAEGGRMLGGVEYPGFGPDGLRIRREGGEEVLPVNDVVLCTGQKSERALARALADAGRPFHLIGGAAQADQIDAKRAIEEGVRLGLQL